MSTFQASAIVCALLVSLAGLVAGEPFGKASIPASAAGDGSDFDPSAPWIIPSGYEQILVSGESDLDIYTQPTAPGGRSNDWHDMNTVNETRKQAGRYLYRTHEVRGNTERGGVVTVVDLIGGGTKILVEDPSYNALDGIVWAPWGTLLIAEETTNGRFFEIILDRKDPSTAVDVIDRPAVGRLAHEGIQIGPDGAIYVVDEFRGEVSGFGGGVYKFVPNRRGDLSEGNLYALSVTGGPFGTGQGSWVGPIDPLNARNDGSLHGGTGYNRPEDLQRIGNTLYVALTEGPRGGTRSELFHGRVLAIDLISLRVSNFVLPGLNAPIESAGVTGFDSPDNLAKTPDGRLVIIEDNVPSDIWIASTAGNQETASSVTLFASLTDPGGEGSGIYFGKDPKVMFVNVQHSLLDDNDATWAIVKTK